MARVCAINVIMFNIMFYKNLNCTNIQMLYLGDHTHAHTPTIQTTVPREGDNPTKGDDPQGCYSSQPHTPISTYQNLDIIVSLILLLP